MKLLLVACALALVCTAQDGAKSIQPVQVSRRVALLIGNGSYRHQPAIPTASSDVDDMAAALGGLGFRPEDIIIKKNLDMGGMTSALSAFRSRLRAWRPGGVLLFGPRRPIGRAKLSVAGGVPGGG